MSMYEGVIITIGIRLVAGSVLIWRHTSAPSIFGRSLSSRTTSGGSCLTRASALAPSRAIWTTWPRPDSTLTTSRTTSGSSSMTSTRAMLLVFVEHGLDAGPGGRRGPVALVDEVRADPALAVDQRALGHLLDAPLPRDRADRVIALRRVEQHVERHAPGQLAVVDRLGLLERVPVLADRRQPRVRLERLDQRDQDLGPLAVARERHHLELVEVTRHLRERRLLRLAGAAPRGPEVEQDDLAAVVRQLDLDVLAVLALADRREVRRPDRHRARLAGRAQPRVQAVGPGEPAARRRALARRRRRDHPQERAEDRDPHRRRRAADRELHPRDPAPPQVRGQE